MQAERKITVVKSVTNRASIPDEVLDRDFLIDLRRSLLQQLSVVEKKLNTQRRCRQCGADFDLFAK